MSFTTIVIGNGLDDQGVGVRVPVRARILTFASSPDWLYDPASFLYNGYWGREVDHSPATSAKAKKM
jgi:hypothetical protein